MSVTLDGRGQLLGDHARHVATRATELGQNILIELLISNVDLLDLAIVVNDIGKEFAEGSVHCYLFFLFFFLAMGLVRPLACLLSDRWRLPDPDFPLIDSHTIPNERASFGLSGLSARWLMLESPS